MKDSQIKKYGNSQFLYLHNPSLWPLPPDIEQYQEPMVRGTIICPHEYMGSVLGLAGECRGEQLSVEGIDQIRTKMEFLLPLNEIVVDFFDRLKCITSGYGSFDYEDAGYQETLLTKIDILLNDQCVQELSCIVHTSRAREKAKSMVNKLQENIPRQQFKIKIQATCGSHILARQDINPYRKDVTAKCYGGDVTRKMKLLKHQAEGKKRLRSFGNIDISKETFIKLLT